MLSFFLWVLVMLVIGTAAFPVLFRLFPHLSDRGYGLAKPAGLLIFGFLYWILVTFRILPNSWSGVAAVFLLTFVPAVLATGKKGWAGLKAWYDDNRSYVWLVEAGWVVLFAFFAFLRASSPDIIGTEKPMELAFINSILHSKVFPPADPWLSGYAISYYYFGYVIVAGLIRLSGVLPGVGFNLAIALWFSMACLGIFSLVLNIIARLPHNQKAGESARSRIKYASGALLGPLFLVFLGNWEGLLEFLHSIGFGNASFWTWMDIKELTTAPAGFTSWLPARPGGIWWWRASRVVQDYNLVSNDPIEVIDEFPFFSLFLSDLHPHVLSIPFVLLAATLALELFFRAGEGRQFRPGWYETLKGWLTGIKASEATQNTFLPSGMFWAGAVLFGGLAFMNIWDFPIYVGLASAGIVLARYLAEGWNRERVIEFLECGLAFGIAGFLLYLPFYVGFSSQAGGLLPSLAFFTPGKHLWIMFGVLWVPIIAGLLTSKTDPHDPSIGEGIWKAYMLTGILWAVMLVVGFIFTVVPQMIGSINPQRGTELSILTGQFFSLQGGATVKDLLLDSSLKRLAAPGSWLTLTALLAMVWVRVLQRRKQIILAGEKTGKDQLDETNRVSSFPFVFLAVAVGIGLVFFPEFFYLRDQFGTRMNTIFKFYYQAWILWSVAAAVLMTVFFRQKNGGAKIAGTVVLMVSVIAGVFYPFYGLYDRFSGLQSQRLTLDGNKYFTDGYPDETAAIEFLRQAPDGTVVEAVGGSYSGFARVATLSGQANVLGWPGHESQWRGGAAEMGSREQDIKQLYQTSNWNEALGIIQKYKIRYIYIGSLEQSAYHVNEQKFSSNLPVAYGNSTVVIYEVPDQLLTPTPK